MQDKGSTVRNFSTKGGGVMSLTEAEYDALTKRYSKNSKPWINVPKAFLIGGGICALGQGLIEFYTRLGLSPEAGPGLQTTFVNRPPPGAPAWASTTKSLAMPAPVPWCPSPALPMPWSPRRWNSKARG